MGYLDGSQPAPTQRADGPLGFKWIRDAVRFKTTFDVCRSDAALCSLAQRKPEFFWAYWMFNEPDFPARWAVEARILAREDDFSIGAKTGMLPETIAVYEALFFNVREKLIHQDYIVQVVLRNAIQRGISQREYDLLMKMYGYFIGPHMVDIMCSGFVNPQWCGTADAAAAAIQDDTIGTMKMRAMLSAKTVAINTHTQLPLLELFAKFVEIERTTNSADKTQNQVLEHVNAMFVALPLSVNGLDPRQKHRRIAVNSRTPFDKSAVELNYSEILQVSMGQPIRDAEHLLTVDYPPLVAQAPSAGGNDAKNP